jgi:hypothetical protein
MTLSTTTLGISVKCLYAEDCISLLLYWNAVMLCHYAEYRYAVIMMSGTTYPSLAQLF